MIVTAGPDLQRFYKAQSSAADIALYDLEDGVCSSLKEAARDAFLKVSPEDLLRPLAVRINSPRSIEGMLDLEMLDAAAVQPIVVVLPKVESAEDVQSVDDLLTRSGSHAWLWAIVESGVGVLKAHEIAQSSKRLTALSFGAADFCADLGIALKWEPLLHARSQVVLAARTAGLGVLDSPTFQLDDPAVLARESVGAADLGFTGKIIIHPKQIQAVSEAFTPSAKQLAWAESVVKAFEDREGSITTVHGHMVGPPFLLSAQRILTQAKQGSE